LACVALYAGHSVQTSPQYATIGSATVVQIEYGASGVKSQHS
jgi:hypothetical protein